VKLFILGRPGAGKSTLARQLGASFKKLPQLYRNEYNILSSMSHDLSAFDTALEKLSRELTAYPNGFNVPDLSAFDTALEKLSRELTAYPNGFNVLDLSAFDTALEKLSREIKAHEQFIKGIYQAKINITDKDFGINKFDLELYYVNKYIQNLINKIIEFTNRLKAFVRYKFTQIEKRRQRILSYIAIALQILYNISSSPTPRKNEPPVGGVKVGRKQHDGERHVAKKLYPKQILKLAAY
jgi:hypothetical protein